MSKRNIGAGVMLVHEGEILLGFRNPNMRRYPAHWGIPGGRIDEGENELQAAMRELQEEVVLLHEAPVSGKVIGSYRETEVSGGESWHYTTIFIELDSKPAPWTANDNETVMLAWFTPDDIRKTRAVMPGVLRALPRLEELIA